MGVKHRYSIVAALLAALLVALLSGGALAEDRIELGVDGPEVTIEEIPAGDDLELDFGEDMAQDDLSLELPKDGLALDDALILSEALLTDDNPVEPEQNAIAPNEGEDIPIDEAHFPDENLRSVVGMYDTTRDGVLSAEERSGVTFFSLSGSNFTNLKGLEYFPGLKTLWCMDCGLTSLDVSGLTALESLYCASNQLTSLNISGLTALEYFDCSYNQLTSLDASGCTALTSFYCFGNPFTSMDVSECTSLKELVYSYSDSLTALDVSGCTSLERLVCSDNQLTSLDASGCMSLKELFCSDNKLLSLNVNGDKALRLLYCDRNNIARLDLTSNQHLIKTIKKGSYEEYGSRLRYSYDEYDLWFDKTTEVIANGKTLYAPIVSLRKCTISGIENQVYTGKAIKPIPVLKYGDKVLKKGVDYMVAYSSNKDIGVATVTVTGKGYFKDAMKKTFKILPKAVKLSSLTPGKGQLTVKWKKGVGGVSYELQYSLKKDFSTKKTVTVSKTDTVKQVIKKLASGKIWYVRIRAFKMVDKNKYVSDWSDVLSKKVK